MTLSAAEAAAQAHSASTSRGPVCVTKQSIHHRRAAALAKAIDVAIRSRFPSDDSSYVDGQLLSVDGGVSSTHPYGRIAL